MLSTCFFQQTREFRGASDGLHCGHHGAPNSPLCGHHGAPDSLHCGYCGAALWSPWCSRRSALVTLVLQTVCTVVTLVLQTVCTVVTMVLQTVCTVVTMVLQMVCTVVPSWPPSHTGLVTFSYHDLLLFFSCCKIQPVPSLNWPGSVVDDTLVFFRSTHFHKGVARSGKAFPGAPVKPPR